MISLEAKIKAKAKSLGFSALGITNAHHPPHYKHYLDWVNKGYHENMWYLAENTRKEKRSDLKKLMPNVASSLIATLSYNHKKAHANDIKFARYGWGNDYHDFIKDLFKELRDYMQTELGLNFETKIVTDTAPVLERDFAMLAGIGWIGKNTMLLNQKDGSYVYIGMMMTNLNLKEDTPTSMHCGTCTACIDACPTDAIEKPFILNPGKCITYHTIENKKEAIPRDIEDKLHGWVAGCDICQEVCPWNNKALPASFHGAAPQSHVQLSAKNILDMSPDQYQVLFSKTAFSRIGFEKLQRNVKSAIKGLLKEKKSQNTP